MFERHSLHGVIFYTSRLLQTHGFSHLFATRFGGVSTGAFDSLNVSTSRKDENGCTDTAENVAANYTRALSVIGISPDKAAAAKQVHSDNIAEATEDFNGINILPYRTRADGFDGLITRVSDEKSPEAVCVKTADCVPILLADVTTGDVSAVHAGWRGTVADITAKAAILLSHGKPENILAAIGPCIGKCCYEVGDEVYFAAKDLFERNGKHFDEERLCPVFACCSLGGKRHFDLAETNKQRLLDIGVPAANIETSGICTACFTDEYGTHPFFSHRASGGYSGTFVSLIAKKDQ